MVQLTPKLCPRPWTRKRADSIALTLFLVLLTGCSSSVDAPDAPSSPQPTEPPSIDLSIPTLPPKEVVWYQDWQGVEDTSAERKQAQQVLRIANSLKSSQRYREAEEYYQMAMDSDPTWEFPPYQLACNYELWNKSDQAIELFRKSIDLGFDDFPTAVSDDELGNIRELPEFVDTLVNCRRSEAQRRL